MRQAGILAAAGIVALKMIDRLKDGPLAYLVVFPYL